MSCRSIIAHFENRLFEWMTSMMMLGIAFIIAVSPNSLAHGNFRFLKEIGITQELIGPVFLTFGLARLAALYANGVWQPHGPRLRAIGAIIAALVWGQMCAALFQNSYVTQSISLGVPVYFFLTIGELISCYRAASDVRRHIA